ncbi:unnamed protein product, partial [Mesorhabditis belari]|uniref:Uncharacterized protein n=1 Tax=Mesorhabditis belari TaxID=2138241 RepID=A0AAF3EVA2_9BILA
MEVDDGRFKTALTFLREGIHGEQSHGDREETNHFSIALHHRAGQTVAIANQAHNELWNNLHIWQNNIEDEIAHLEDLEKRLDKRQMFLNNNTDAVQVLIEGIEGRRMATKKQHEESRRTSSSRSGMRKRLSVECSFTSASDPTRAEMTPTEFKQTPGPEVKKHRTTSVVSPVRLPLPAFAISADYLLVLFNLVIFFALFGRFGLFHGYDGSLDVPEYDFGTLALVETLMKLWDFKKWVL